MKKISAIFILLISLTSCWKVNINQETQSWSTQLQENITSSWAQQAAQDTLEEIKNTSQDELSQALKDFLAQDTIDYKAEIQKTLERYNDNYGPVLEYKHVAKPVEETQEETSEEENEDEDKDENENETPEEENNSDQQDSWDDNQIPEDKDYSGEADLGDKDTDNQDETPEFSSITKVWKSGTYISYTPQSGKCNGWLKMIDNQENEKWLFYNTCDKIIYDFELDFWGINVFFKDENDTQWETFVTIE